MLLLKIDPTHKTPVFRQISESIKSLISSQALSIGDQLPATRKLAVQLGINRDTVIRAYEELWSEGYIESRSGSYSTVRERRELADNVSSGQDHIKWEERITTETKIARQYYLEKEANPQKDSLISFLDLSPDNIIMPVESFRKALNFVLRNKPYQALQYGHAQGYKGLRETLCKQMNKHGISINPDGILIVNGGQNGLDLVCRALLNAGDTVIVEEPGYSMALPLFSFCGANIVGVPMEKDGVSLEKLEMSIKATKPAFFYTMPNFQNPTGITTTQEHREKLIGLCEKYDVPIIEDGFEEEMKYFGKSVLPIKSMDKKGIVIYLGTFSKVLFPGLRIGWVACNPILAQSLTAIKHNVELSGNYLAQVALDEFICQGFYNLHLRKLHKVYRKRMKAALRAISALDFRGKVSFSKPQGGYLIYGKMCDPNISEKQLMDAVKEQDVAITPGSNFYFQSPKNACFRLSIAHLSEEQITEGLHRLAKSIKNL